MSGLLRALKVRTLGLTFGKWKWVVSNERYIVLDYHIERCSGKVLIFGTQCSFLNKVTISQSHGLPGFGRYLWRSSNTTSLLKAGSARAGCPGLCPFFSNPIPASLVSLYISWVTLTLLHPLECFLFVLEFWQELLVHPCRTSCCLCLCELQQSRLEVTNEKIIAVISLCKNRSLSGDYNGERKLRVTEGGILRYCCR